MLWCGHGRDAFAFTPVVAVVAPIRDRSVHLHGASLAVAAEEQPQRVIQTGLVGCGVALARIGFAAQPGALARGQLAGGVECAVAVFARLRATFQLFPRLAIANRPERRTITRRAVPPTLQNPTT